MQATLLATYHIQATPSELRRATEWLPGGAAAARALPSNNGEADVVSILHTLRLILPCPPTGRLIPLQQYKVGAPTKYTYDFSLQLYRFALFAAILR